MKHYVVYHNPLKVGYSATVVDSLEIMTSKPTKCALDNRIWLITGEGKPKKYYLVLTFIADSIGEDQSTPYSNTASGSSGKMYKPMIRIDKKPWFKDFMRSQANFSLGFHLIGGRFVEELEKLRL